MVECDQMNVSGYLGIHIIRYMFYSENGVCVETTCVLYTFYVSKTCDTNMKSNDIVWIQNSTRTLRFKAF